VFLYDELEIRGELAKCNWNERELLELPVRYACIASWACKHCNSYRVSMKEKKRKRKEKFTLFSDHNGSLLRRQPGAMTIGHSPKGKEKS